MLDAAVETLLEEGYAGLTYAKVAVRAGENKSLISYYFGSKQGLVAAVAEVCRDLGILTVAEGIETERQAQVMTELGCDLLQGYYFGRPKRPTRELRLIGG